VQIGTLRQEDELDQILQVFASVLIEEETLSYICLVNDRKFKYMGISNKRLIFVDPNLLVVIRYMPFNHMIKLKFNLGMWHIESKAQPLAYYGFAAIDRKPVHELFVEFDLPIKY
jgi:hypothetical protein